MSDKKKKDMSGIGKPQKFILHMAHYDNDWAGKAVNYSWNEEIIFKSLSEFLDWLKTNEKRNN